MKLSTAQKIRSLYDSGHTVGSTFDQLTKSQHKRLVRPTTGPPGKDNETRPHINLPTFVIHPLLG
jgi:hypothetical protein|tara:strand:+ start:417 stop:611 length:195 start_codon:yes stop_codon:yes gene_type:complete